MEKEIIKEKVEQASQTTQATIKKSYYIPNTLSVLKKDNKTNWYDPIINLKTILKEKIQFLTYGKPLIINYEDKNNNSDIDNLPEKLNLQETLFSSEGIIFENGYTHIVVEKINDKTRLIIADPNFPNYITRINEEKVEAIVWYAFKFNRTQYWKRTRYTLDKIYSSVFASESQKFQDKKELSKKETKNLNKELGTKAITPEMKNSLGIIPVFDISYVPTRNKSIGGLKELAPNKRLKPLQEMLNEATGALRKELFFNTTKILVDKDMLDTGKEDEIANLMKMGIFAILNDSGNSEGDNKVIETQMGDPKVASYWENIVNIIKIAVQSLKLSELGDNDNSSSATESIFNKGNDVETINALSVFRQKDISLILEYARMLETGEKPKNGELDISKWNIQIVPNVIMNEAKLTDIIVKQLGAGLGNMVNATSRLFNISKTDAITLLEEKEEYVNPTLDGVMSFSNNNEDDNDEEENTNTQEITKGENSQNPNGK